MKVVWDFLENPNGNFIENLWGIFMKVVWDFLENPNGNFMKICVGLFTKICRPNVA